MIIGLTGKNASGKGEVANYLKTKGFAYYSLSDVLREEATKLGLEHSRDNLIKLGNELREKNGPNYLAQQINNKIKEQLEKFNTKNPIKNPNNGKGSNETNFVIDSIRSPFEAQELMKNNDFILVGIDAPIELRFKRLRERNRVGDAKTLDAFKEQEQRENLNNAANQQLDETFKLSQKVIVNDGSLEELHKKIDDLLNESK
jgi:dephospho-CoA kinase